MFEGPYKIQYATIFTLFLIWFLNNLFHNGVSLTSKEKEPYDDGPVTAGDIGANPEGTTHARRHRNITLGTSHVSRYADDNILKVFVLLSVGVFLNSIGGGNRTSGDVFSLIILVSVALINVFHYFRMAKVSHGLWFLVDLALFGLYLTPWCTY